MVPGHRPATSSLTSLTSRLADWEGPPLLVLLERFRGALGRLGPDDVMALALATVDVDRAVSATDPRRYQPAPPDLLLGARGVSTVLASGRILLLLEPATEGRLAAFLARHGEGLAALYVRRDGVPASAGTAGLAGAAGRTGATALGRPQGTALGRPGRLVAGERVGDAMIVLVG